VCREAEHRFKTVLYAVNKMVETFVRKNHQCHFSGKGTKPPKGAVVKSHGAERLGKDMP
jgi:hypothetical protein